MKLPVPISTGPDSKPWAATWPMDWICFSRLAITRPANLICVGGGSKNKLWNQIRADIMGIPVKALDMKETTALGAALVAFTGMGVYKSIEDAFSAVESRYEIFNPGANHEQYKEVYGLFVQRVFRSE